MGRVGLLPRRIGPALARLGVLIAIIILGLVIHEAGHALTAILVGRELVAVRVMPGLQLFPAIELVPWPGWVAQVIYSAPETPQQAGLIQLMGCGFTTLAGYGAIAALWLARPRGAARFAGVTAAVLYVWDGIAYSVFPALGLRHWIIIGGSTAEPVRGAAALGVPPTAYALALLADVALAHGLLLGYLAYDRTRPRRP